MINPKNLEKLKLESWAKKPFVKARRFLEFTWYFFNPPVDKIWPDASAGIDDFGREYHVSYTLRNLWVHLRAQYSLKKRIELSLGFIPQKGWAVGAIAFDSAAAGVTGANPSGTLTVTGSNPVVILTTVSGNSTDPTAAS